MRRRAFIFRGSSPIAVDAWLLQPLCASRNATLGQPSLQGGRAKYALTQWSVVVGGYLRHLRACHASDALKLRGSGEKPQNLGIRRFYEFPPSEVHAAHAAHAAAARHCRRVLLRMLGDRRLGGDNQAGDRRRVLKRGAHDLGRVDDAELHEIAELAGLRVVAVTIFLRVEQLAHDDRAVAASVVDDLASRRLDRLAHDVDAGLLVGIGDLHGVERGDGAQQRDAAARRNAFLDRRAGGVEGVVDAVLLLLDLDLGRAADADHRDAARELGQTLLQLLAIIVRGGVLDLRLDLGDARLDALLVASAVDDRGGLLVDAHALGAAELGQA